MSNLWGLSRREFLVITGAAAVSTLSAPSADATQSRETRRVYMYRLSSRGKRASNASKLHNANHLFAIKKAARAHRAHPGDRSRIVRLETSKAFHKLIFASGNHHVDLRQLR